jgi:hypothetical protein
MKMLGLAFVLASATSSYDSMFLETRMGTKIELTTDDFRKASFQCFGSTGESVGPVFWECFLEQLTTQDGPLASLSKAENDFLLKDYEGTLENSRHLLMQLRNFTCSMDDEGTPVIETKVCLPLPTLCITSYGARNGPTRCPRQHAARTDL